MENLTFANVSPIKKWWCSIVLLVFRRVRVHGIPSLLWKWKNLTPLTSYLRLRDLYRVNPIGHSRGAVHLSWWCFGDNGIAHLFIPWGRQPAGEKKHLVSLVESVFCKKYLLKNPIHPKFHRNLLELFQNSLSLYIYIRILHHLNDLNRWVHGSWIPIKKKFSFISHNPLRMVVTAFGTLIWLADTFIIFENYHFGSHFC